MVVAPTDPPVANFFVQNTNVCSGQTIAFENTSSNGQTYQWSFTGGTPAISSDVEPLVSYSASGTYNVQLIVTGPGGIDTLDQTVSIDVSQPVNAQFGTNAVDLYLPNAIITCTNNSTNANGYFWDFGDGSTSSDANPWHQYMQEGDYTITLIGVNNACPNDTATQVVHVHDDLSVSEANLSSVLLYPNPSTGIVTVSSPNAELNNVKVYDEFGKLVVEQQLDQQENKVDLSRFANGTYLFRILNKTGQETLRKLVVL
jgi:PKD repeat protein